jgi:hypothetical protein
VPAPAAVPARTESRQRWRLTFARAATSDRQATAGRDYVALWEQALVECGLPVATTDAGRLRFSLAAPLPARTSGRAELADLWLTRRLAAWRVRESLDGRLPSEHQLISLEDVWLGAPALAGRVAAADYLVTFGGLVDGEVMAAAAERLLAADRLDRKRAKGGGVKTYDLRPLLISIDVAVDRASAGLEAAPMSGAEDARDQRVVVRLRTRIHPELGSGRPDEVIAALADDLGLPLEPLETVREGLVLGDDLTR